MAEMTGEQRRAQVLADFQEAVDDKESVLRDPEGYLAPIMEQLKVAAACGAISAEDLREGLEWAESAQAWAVEELLTRQRNP